jgi:molecular chaperone DnaK
VEKTITENREKLSSQDVSRIETLIAEVRQAAQAENLVAIKEAMDELQRASHAIAEQLYKGSQGSQGSRDSQGSSNTDIKDAEVVDGEYAEAS